MTAEYAARGKESRAAQAAAKRMAGYVPGTGYRSATRSLEAETAGSMESHEQALYTLEEAEASGGEHVAGTREAIRTHSDGWAERHTGQDARPSQSSARAHGGEERDAWSGVGPCTWIVFRSCSVANTKRTFAAFSEQWLSSETLSTAGGGERSLSFSLWLCVEAKATIKGRRCQIRLRFLVSAAPQSLSRLLASSIITPAAGASSSTVQPPHNVSKTGLLNNTHVLPYPFALHRHINTGFQ